MLTIICGEDSATSRNYFYELKNNYKKQGSEIYNIDSSQLTEITSWMGDSPSLFSQKKVFFTQGINKKISKKAPSKNLRIIEEIIKDKNIELIDWEEEISARFLKIGNGVTVKEFKPNENIFKLLDSCYPGNIKQFLTQLHLLSETVEGGFIFIMLQRHIRNLLLLSLKLNVPKLAPWQAAKLKGQSSKWDTKKLLGFYESLHRIDVSTKTSTNPYSMTNSLDIVACYFL